MLRLNSKTFLILIQYFALEVLKQIRRNVSKFINTGKKEVMLHILPTEPEVIQLATK
jgi:hypothetical protein